MSPYQSRSLVIETDAITTAAYLQDERGTTIAVTWIANHRPAPQNADVEQPASGRIPVMPAAYTRHPRGRPPIDPDTIEVVWFEEGDGVALLEGGEPLCVIPGWAGVDRGIPGYCRAMIGGTPFAWALDDAMEGLGARIRQARSFWDWRNDAGSWAGFQGAALGHLLNRLGPGGAYWDAGGRRLPVVGVSERPATEQRPFTVLSTVGMSCQRMPTIEQYVDDVSDYARIELAVGTTLPSQQAARIFLWLGQYPWRSVTWFGPGHNVKWYHSASTFPLGPRFEGVLLLENPGDLGDSPVPDLTGFGFGGDSVRWLWLIPITENERQIAKTDSAEALVERLAEQGRSWVVGE